MPTLSRLCGAALLLAAPAAAQDPAGTDMMSYYGTSVPLEVEVKQSLRQPPARAHATRPARGDFTYAATPALRRQIVTGFVDRVRRGNPQAAAAAAQAFAGHDYAAVYDGIVRENGLAGDDATRAMTAYLVFGWLVANGIEREPDAAAIAGVRAQVASGLARDRRMAAPATRAQLGEEFKILYVLLHAGYRGAVREGSLPRYREGVARLMQRTSGLDMRTVRLGNGFEPKR
jgi:hypothetical protein